MTNAPATITISDSTCHRLNCRVFVSTFVAAAAVAVSVPPSSSHQEPVSPSPPSPSSFRRRPLAAVSVVVVSTAAVKDPPGPSSPSPFLVPENIRICTRAKEKEDLQAEQQLFNPLVMDLARDEKLLETNKMMLVQYATRRDFLEKFRVLLDATITFQCTLMKMLTAQQFNCLVTNEPTRTYLGFPGWIPLATTYEMEAGERATFYLDYDRDEVMVYYRLTGSDDDAPLTPDYVPDSTLRNVE
ncbi:hypothetical protein D1007_20458 [Hordeum vulgare]|nr:hypothetical protein D1007_20458 [Hordeum vulgare]